MEFIISRRNSSFCAHPRPLVASQGLASAFHNRPSTLSAHLVQKYSAGHIANLLFSVPVSPPHPSAHGQALKSAEGTAQRTGALCGRDQVRGLFVPKLNLIAEHVDVKQLPYILFLVVFCASKSLVTKSQGAERR